MDAQPIDVLLVEDSPGDIRLTQEALKDAKIHINLHVARDGDTSNVFLECERGSMRMLLVRIWSCSI